MKFGSVAVADAEGGILTHAVRTGEQLFKKGRVLTADDIAALKSAGIEQLVAARPETDDVPEDEAAARIARKLGGEGVRLGPAFTGRSNLYATVNGLAVLDPECIDAINAVDESITLATLPRFEHVRARQMVATVKIIPFATPRPAVEQVEALLGKPAIQVAAFRPRKVALLLTTLPQTRAALLDKTRTAIAARVENIGSETVFSRDCPHAADALSGQLRDAAEVADLILVFGAGAITDRRDVIPAAIEQAGGTVARFGMPVDPGNLLLVGKLGHTDVVGLPGCARSPKLNGFDFVLWRLVAGLPVGSKEIAAMGVGGLLTEIPLRPQPRDEPATSRAPLIGAVVLAAGASSRMGRNKLLTEISGKPLVRHVVEAAIASHASPIVVVTGKDAAQVKATLAHYAVVFVDNPEYSKGLSTSLKCGLRTLPDDCDGAVVLLGDMPAVAPALIDRLIAAFDPAEGRAICLATHGGKRGNPVLFARRFFAEIESIEGDVGARGLIGAYPELVCDVEAENDAPLIDIDTPEDLAAYRKEHP
jgi:molybdenum cofactor cytidylyltransferase